MNRLPEKDPSLPNTAQGLYRKFDVRRTDGSSQPGGKHEDCEYFVLDVTHDPLAKAALTAYADAAEASHPQLAADMRRQYGLKIGPNDGAKARELLREAYAKRWWLEMPAFLRVDSKLSDKDEIAIEAITRALQAQPAEGCAPEGFVLVPVEPTEAMVEAVAAVKLARLRAFADGKDGVGAAAAIREEYTAILAAAPKPATTTGEGVGGG